MVFRIVKMEFQADRVDEFDALFERYRSHIEASPGCLGVKLVSGTDQPHVRTTLSWWEGSEHLETYRNSALFAEVWPRTKALFSARPVAWSSHWPADMEVPTAK